MGWFEGPAWMDWLVLLSGVLFLLADLEVFDWGLSWWTVTFVLMGLSAVVGK